MVNLSVCDVVICLLSELCFKCLKVFMWLGDSLCEKFDIFVGGMGSDDDEDEVVMGGDLIDFEFESL